MSDFRKGVVPRTHVMHSPLPEIEIPPLQLLVTVVPVIVLLLSLADYMLE